MSMAGHYDCDSAVFNQCGKSEQPKRRLPEVEVVRVQQKDVPIWHEWVGTLDGFVTAQIRPQVTGYLLRQTYKEGSFVKKGDEGGGGESNTEVMTG
jgi:membrane fusion protein (multidrug efflux system)